MLGNSDRCLSGLGFGCLDHRMCAVELGFYDGCSCIELIALLIVEACPNVVVIRHPLCVSVAICGIKRRLQGRCWCRWDACR